MWTAAAALATTPTLLPWRGDGRCGDGVTAPDGTQPAQCNPWDAVGQTCCDPSVGVCVGSTTCTAATCKGCMDYKIRKAWRDDDRCGPDLKGGDGRKPALCHPLHTRNLTCCSEEGWCGAWPSYAHCRCQDCVNHHATCACTLSTPCQDPSSGRCYPRTQSAEEKDGSLIAEDPAVGKDRRPELDPRRSMRSVSIEDQFDKRAAAAEASRMAAKEAFAQRPIVNGQRCAVGLVDCPATFPAAEQLISDSFTSTGTASGSLLTANSTSFSASASNLTQGAAEEQRSDSPLSPVPPLPPSPPPPQSTPPSPPPLPIRLAGGDRPREGRLELLFNGTWGSICSKGWSWTAAHVACKSLGFGGVESVSESSAYGPGFGPIWLSHVDCEGHEPRLELCKYFGLGESTIPPACSHQVDAGVQCSRQSLPVPQYTPLAEHATVRNAPRAVAQPRRRQLCEEGSLCGRGVGQHVAGAEAPPSQPQPLDLESALDALEVAIEGLELRRPLIDESHLSRMTRLRLRLRRLAGRPDEQSTGACVPASPAPSAATPPEADPVRKADEVAAELGIPSHLAGRLSSDMLKELRHSGPPKKPKSLAEDRAEFEARIRQDTFDPLANDPVEIALRNKRDQYVPPGSRPAPLEATKPHERLRKPPIQNLANRRPPNWKDAYDARYEYTMEQIRLGLAPEGIERTLGPGPWDHDPSFWGGKDDHDVVLDHELDDDIVFDM